MLSLIYKRKSKKKKKENHMIGSRVGEADHFGGKKKNQSLGF